MMHCPYRKLIIDLKEKKMSLNYHSFETKISRMTLQNWCLDRNLNPEVYKGDKGYKHTQFF